MTRPDTKWLMRWAMASMVPLAVLLISAFWRPLWRDEVWALYYSDPSLSLSGVTERLYNNVHPPLYFYILHFWRQVFDNIIWYKLLNLVFIAAGGAAIWRIGRYRRFAFIFLLLAIGSFWLIYFAGIVRPYALMFVLGSLSVFVLARIIDTDDDKLWILLFLWTVIGALNCLSHYFALLWTGFGGLFAGIWFLYNKNFSRFFAIGFASVLAVLPALLWIYLSYDKIGFVNSTPPFSTENFLAGTKQFLRGMIKLFFSNPGAYLLAILVFIDAVKSKKLKIPPQDKIISLAILATITALFVLHISWQPLIKERSLMVVIPAIIFLTTRFIIAAPAEKFPRLKNSIAVFAAIMPLFYFGEYFKDREKLSQVRELLPPEQCAGEPVFVYFRKFPEGEDFGEYYLRFALPDIKIIPAGSANKDRLANVVNSACPTKALALVMPRGEREEHDKARASFIASGLNVTDFAEIKPGKGRNLLWVRKQNE